MPELPEIETIKNVIEPQIKGLTMEKIVINRPEIIAHPTADEFGRAVTGQIISSVARRGKFFIIHLTNGSRMILHLRMTGCLLVTPPDYPLEKHTHMIMQLNSGAELRFSDTRRLRAASRVRSSEFRHFRAAACSSEAMSAACWASVRSSIFRLRASANSELIVSAAMCTIFQSGRLYHPGRGACKSNVSRVTQEMVSLGLEKTVIQESGKKLPNQIADVLVHFGRCGRISVLTGGSDLKVGPALGVTAHGTVVDVVKGS